MKMKCDLYSFILGLLIGVTMVCVFGAAAGPNDEVYQLSLAANEDYVFFGRIHSVSGKIETWKYRSHANHVVPLHGDKRNGQVTPGIIE